MGFVDGFFSFKIDLSDSERAIYTTFRVKTPKHPDESFEHLVARVIALTHSWEEELNFSEGLFKPAQPTIWKQNLLGKIESWIEVGVPEKKKLERALRQDPPSKQYTIYFYEEEQIKEFCHLLRGSKQNWVAAIKFYLIDPKALSQLIEGVTSSTSWSISIVDESLYMSCGEQSFTLMINALDIWSHFQLSIQNAESIEA